MKSPVVNTERGPGHWHVSALSVCKLTRRISDDVDS